LVGWGSRLHRGGGSGARRRPDPSQICAAHVLDSTHPEALLGERLTYVPAVFAAAGLFPTGLQLVALELMEHADNRPRDVTAIPLYRSEGHHVADELIARCHREYRSSAYLNLDLDDDAPALDLDVVVSQRNSAGTIVVFRDQPPTAGSQAQVFPPPGVNMPELGGQ
jgi:hypothetical protein